MGDTVFYVVFVKVVLRLGCCVVTNSKMRRGKDKDDFWHVLIVWFFNSITIIILSKILSVPGLGLQIQCYQCEEFQLNNDCSAPEFIVNCTVNVQDMCQKEVMEKSFGKNSVIILLFICVGLHLLVLAPPIHSLQLQMNLAFLPKGTRFNFLHRLCNSMKLIIFL